jgi:nitrogen fixation/metabolism regulation signal transduction histidine kinase
MKLVNKYLFALIILELLPTAFIGFVLIRGILNPSNFNVTSVYDLGVIIQFQRYGIMMLIILIGLTSFVSIIYLYNMMRPIHKLNKAALAYMNNEPYSFPEIKTRDEIENLSKTMNMMVTALEESKNKVKKRKK